MKGFVILFLAIVLLMPAVFSASCNVADDSQLIFRISTPTNAHAEVYNGAGGYLEEICYNTIFGLVYSDVATVHSDNGTNAVLTLSTQTNAHAATGGYPTAVYYGDLVCNYADTIVGDDCSDFGADSVCIATISGTTNAHVSSDCVTGYPIKVCCISAVASNAVPVADAGGPYTIVLPNTTIDLDGSQSTDKEDCGVGITPCPMLDYSWKITNNGASCDPSTSNVMQPLPIICKTEGVSTVTLTVTDSDGGRNKDSKFIVVNSVAGSGALKIIKLLVNPVALNPGDNFANLDVSVLNTGAAFITTKIKLEVLDAVTSLPTTISDAVGISKPIDSAGTGVWDSTILADFSTSLNLSTLPSGSYQLVVKAYDITEVDPLDIESVFFTVAQPAAVPELDFVFIPLLALSVLAVLFFAGKKNP